MARTNEPKDSGKGHSKDREGFSAGRGGKGKNASTKVDHAKDEKTGYGSSGSKSSGGTGSSQGSGGGHGGAHG